MKNRRSSVGFSLLECLVALAIMAILSAMAIPTYLQYTRRAYYSSLVQATTPYQFGVALCLQSQGVLSACHAGENGIPNAIRQSENISSLTVNRGVIHLIPRSKHGFSKEDDYLLTPTLTAMGLNWQSSGGAVTKGYAH